MCNHNICFYVIRGVFDDNSGIFFSYSDIKTYVVGTSKKYLAEAILMSTHNICFYGEFNIPFSKV